MSHTIFCTFLQRIGEKQDIQTYPGEIGRRIYEEISKEAWQAWMNKQTILINEKKLNMMNSHDRNFLEKKMIQFLFEGHDFRVMGHMSLKQ